MASAGRPHDIEVAESFAELARVLLEERDVDRTLDRMCQLAVEMIDGCEAAGISIVRGRRVESRSTTDHIPRAVDDIQSETQQGPCVDAIREFAVFVSGALSAERRWPDFSSRAHRETQIESVLSLRLFVQEDTMGALNLYSSRRDAFGDHDVAVGSVFAAHAAVALDNAMRQAQLETKAETSGLIGMAKGIIMARQNVTEEQAFDILRRASQRMNVKLRHLADQVVHPPAVPPEGVREAAER